MLLKTSTLKHVFAYAKDLKSGGSCHKVKLNMVSRFDDLPSEIIICIFDYLSCYDRYKSLFGCNIRLNRLIKRWTSFDPKILDVEINNYSTRHYWYKYLTLENGGVEFLIAPCVHKESFLVGQDVRNIRRFGWCFFRNDCDTVITDDRVRQILLRHTFRLNPFFYPGFRLRSPIVNAYGQQSSPNMQLFEPWIKINYPQVADKILKLASSTDTNNREFESILRAERLKAKETICEAASQVWEELREIDDFNPFSEKEWVYRVFYFK